MDSTKKYYKKGAVLGAGSFGTALSAILANNGVEVSLWAREPEIIEGIQSNRRNPVYIPTLELPSSVMAQPDLSKALDGAEFVLIAVPSHAMREISKSIAPMLRGDEVVTHVAKGLEEGTLLRMTQVLEETLKGVISNDQLVVLSGPSHAEDVAEGLPTTVVVSCRSHDIATCIQHTFTNDRFRLYVNADVIGVEIAGAVKNIMAIAGGVSSGLGLGDNAMAALMTRGLHEISRMGMAMGAQHDTFAGLAGMGDLIVTCSSEHSRNRRVGWRIAHGESLDEITKSMNMVAEGVKTTRAVHQWAQEHGLEMPITAVVYGMLFDGLDPREAMDTLMTRAPKNEIHR
ncbi:MAG: NAD(P)H-dependent glycerol-3-phosphate dehydrogenase [Balneolaceae bacterium]|nr:NAD(P)H-dependent glycerol-3-phosphate dehydrogenase [Balneolaceae bacterium]